MKSATTTGVKVTLIRICTGSGCSMNGSLDAADRLEAVIEEAGAADRISVVRTGCHGLCELGPIAVIGPEGLFYPRVTEDKAVRIIEALLAEEGPVDELLYRESDGGEPYAHYEDVPFNRIQQRIVLRNCGIIDPESLDDAVRHHGYEGLRRAVTTLTAEEVIAEVEASGLRGRGGAGFSTGTKWRLTHENASRSECAYVICNADEGDPGAFMDRSVLEGDPHSVLEGLAIAAYAIGASRGFVYVRAEYPLAVRRLRQAVEAAKQAGLLGDRVCGSEFSFTVEVREGAGAFVCGEETALIASIEGRRGMPRARPPFPAQSGLWRMPTCINNVETLANVSWILRNGAEKYAAIGSGTSRGTKVFAVTGNVRRGGLVEVPMGMTVRELVYDIGGGCPDGRSCRAVQLGGPSGGCLPEELFDVRVEYEALAEAGAIVGSGGLVVLDDRTCMVDLARFFLSFTQHESCGKCVPCRVGTKRMLEIVTRICEGQGEAGDIDKLEQLALDVKRTSLCGLGQTAPNPVLTTLRYFREEYEEHISQRRCRAGACTKLGTFRVIAEKCTGCQSCVGHCPVGAIQGGMKQVHRIDEAACIRCGACAVSCPSEAIEAY